MLRKVGYPKYLFVSQGLSMKKCFGSAFRIEKIVQTLEECSSGATQGNYVRIPNGP